MHSADQALWRNRSDPSMVVMLAELVLANIFEGRIKTQDLRNGKWLTSLGGRRAQVLTTRVGASAAAPSGRQRHAILVVFKGLHPSASALGSAVLVGATDMCSGAVQPRWVVCQIERGWHRDTVTVRSPRAQRTSALDLRTDLYD